jgi:hypothetical protein
MTYGATDAPRFNRLRGRCVVQRGHGICRKNCQKCPSPRYLVQNPSSRDAIKIHIVGKSTIPNRAFADENNLEKNILVESPAGDSFLNASLCGECAVHEDPDQDGEPVRHNIPG